MSPYLTCLCLDIPGIARYIPGVCLGDGQTEVYLKDMVMAGLASVWAMARRRTKEYRHNVDAAPAYAPTPDLIYSSLHDKVPR